MRTLLMTTVLTTCCFATPLASASEPVKKAEVRDVDLKELPRKPVGQVQKPAVITNISELAECLGFCLKERLPYELAKEVNFEKEQLLFFAWTGSGQDKLTFQIVNCAKQRNPVTFQYQRGTTQDRRSHFRLVVVPKYSPWSVAD